MPYHHTEAPLDTQLELKKRSRRRLVGAAALALLAAIVLPVVMEGQPRQAAPERQVKIRAQDGEQAPRGAGGTVAKPAQKLAVVPPEPANGGETEPVPATNPASKPGADKSTGKSGDKSGEKSADKPAAKSSEKPVTKLVDKPVEKPADKPASKATEHKPADKKPVEKANKVADKPADKPADKAATEKAAQDKAAHEKALHEKAAQEKAAQEKAAQEKAAAEKVASEKPATDKSATKQADKKPAEKSPPAKPAPSKDEEARALAALNGTASPSSDQWVVQLGAYKESNNPKNLLAKLKQMGVPAYAENYQSPQGPRTRVRAGPFKSREDAEKAKVKIRIVGVDGPVAPR